MAAPLLPGAELSAAGAIGHGYRSSAVKITQYRGEGGNRSTDCLAVQRGIGPEQEP